MALNSNVIWSPAGAAADGVAHYDQSIISVSGFRCSAYVRHVSGGGSTGNGGFLTLRNSLGVLQGFAAINNRTVGTNRVFAHGWQGENNFQDIDDATTLNTWYRVGIEIEPEKDAVRFYWNSNLGQPTTLAEDNAKLTLMDTLSLGLLLDDLLYAGFIVAVGGGPDVAPDGVGPDFTGFDNLLIEEFVPTPWAPGTFPTGAFFQPFQDDPYALHKSTLTLHALLTNARVQ
jgi:hypothetical protein